MINRKFNCYFSFGINWIKSAKYRIILSEKCTVIINNPTKIILPFASCIIESVVCCWWLIVTCHYHSIGIITILLSYYRISAVIFKAYSYITLMIGNKILIDKGAAACFTYPSLWHCKMGECIAVIKLKGADIIYCCSSAAIKYCLTEFCSCCVITILYIFIWRCGL